MKMTTSHKRVKAAVVIAGSNEGVRECVDGIGEAVRFDGIEDMFELANGDVLIADFNSHRIRLLESKTRRVSTFAGSRRGYRNASALVAQFQHPSGITGDEHGSFFVT